MVYVETARAVDRLGRIGLWSLVGLPPMTPLIFAPPPPSSTAVAWAGLAVWVLVAWVPGGWAPTSEALCAAFLKLHETIQFVLELCWYYATGACSS
jgi:hypothetical protein